MDLKSAATTALSTLKRRRNLVIFFAIAHVIFLAFGEWAVATGIPGVLEIREEMLKELKDLPYLKPLTGVFADLLILKILYTFFFNLIFGAFVSTTLTGIVFFLPYLIAVWRSFVIGILFYGLETTRTGVVVFYGTFLLEFGAYTFSSVAGTDIGLAILWPSRKGVESRREAFLLALNEAKSLYFFVVLLLALGAVWEMSWIHYTGPLMKSPTPQ